MLHKIFAKKFYTRIILFSRPLSEWPRKPRRIFSIRPRCRIHAKYATFPVYQRAGLFHRFWKVFRFLPSRFARRWRHAGRQWRNCIPLGRESSTTTRSQIWSQGRSSLSTASKGEGNQEKTKRNGTLLLDIQLELGCFNSTYKSVLGAWSLHYSLGLSDHRVPEFCSKFELSLYLPSSRLFELSICYVSFTVPTVGSLQLLFRFWIIIYDFPLQKISKFFHFLLL